MTDRREGHGSAAPAADAAPGDDRGVYGISVAAELVGTGVQNLRLYEARGLLAPSRTEGGTRRYSASDVRRLRRIGDLLGDGLNLAGIRMVLDLESHVDGLRSDNADLRSDNADLRSDNVRLRAAARKGAGDPARGATGRRRGRSATD